MDYTIAIVGRPNVGKSTFFNRMVNARQAIVHNSAGVTRDRQYGQCEWAGKTFHIVDTGGLVESSKNWLERAIAEQVHEAIREASALIFMVDAHVGLHGLDRAIANALYRADKKVYLVINKVDTFAHSLSAAEFHALGFADMFPVCSTSGAGTGELLDSIIANMPTAQDQPLEPGAEPDEVPYFAIVGRPNVGKSTLLNALIRQNRSVVSDLAGTTRDAVSVRYTLFQKQFVLVDTAGVRKKSAAKEDIEFYAIVRAFATIDKADLVFLVLDATEGIQQQDLHLFERAYKKGKAVVVLVNKWDLCEKQTNTARDFEKHIRTKLAPLSDVPVLFISALYKQRIFKAIEVGLEVVQKRNQKIHTSALNQAIQQIFAARPAPAYRGVHIRVKYAVQLPKVPPTFLLFCNHPKHVQAPYRQYLENRLREVFDLRGVPIVLYFRDKNAGRS